MTVGQKLRDLREEKGWSLRALAGRAGVSASLVSQIETGRVDASLNTLRKLALALDVPLFRFVLEEAAQPATLIRQTERRRVLFPDAGLSYEIINSDLRRKMGVMIGTLAPDGSTSAEPLPHAGEECLVILEGGLTIEVGRETLDLTAGDSLYFDSSTPHRLHNPRPTPCRFYLIITPPKF